MFHASESSIVFSTTLYKITISLEIEYNLRTPFNTLYKSLLQLPATGCHVHTVSHHMLHQPDSHVAM